MFQTKFVYKIKKTHIMFNKHFSENRAVCEINWEDVVEPDIPQI